MKRGVSFFEMDLKGISLEDRKTFCPGEYLGATIRRRSTKRWFWSAVRWRAATVLDQMHLHHRMWWLRLHKYPSCPPGRGAVGNLVRSQNGSDLWLLRCENYERILPRIEIYSNQTDWRMRNSGELIQAPGSYALSVHLTGGDNQMREKL